MNPQFFVVGTPRSGTTLARAILTGHPDVEIPGETGFLPRLLQLRWLWWGREGVRSGVFTRLICANGRLARAGLSRPEVRRLVDEDDPRTPLETVDLVYAELGRRAGATVVGDKTPLYIDHLPRLATAYPDARFIQMVRHPLDTVSSLMTQPWGPDDPLAAALQWDRSQRAARRAALGGRLLTVRLEDLVADPAPTVRDMAEHLGLSPTDAMLAFADRAERIADQNVHPGSHRGLGRSLVRTRDWADHLDPRQAAEAWAIVRVTAESLGYGGPDGTTVPAPRARAWRAETQFRLARQRKRLTTLRRVVGR